MMIYSAMLIPKIDLEIFEFVFIENVIFCSGQVFG